MKLIFVGFLFLSLHAHAEDRTGRIYEVGKTEAAKPLYIQKTHKDVADGHVNHKSVIAEPEGKVIMSEEAEYTGLAIKFNHVMQMQTKESYRVDIADGKISYKTCQIEDDGVEKLTKESSQKLGETFILGPISEDFVRSKWDEIMSGKTVNARLAVLEIQDTVGFDFSKISFDDSILRVKMKPSAFFISMMVSPIELRFDVNKKMIRYIGRTPMKKMVDGKLKPFDAEIIYE